MRGRRERRMMGRKGRKGERWRLLTEEGRENGREGRED